jgi:hypothetical protein
MQPESKGSAVTEMLGEIWRTVTGHKNRHRQGFAHDGVKK